MTFFLKFNICANVAQPEAYTQARCFPKSKVPGLEPGSTEDWQMKGVCVCMCVVYCLFQIVVTSIFSQEYCQTWLKKEMENFSHVWSLTRVCVAE